MLKKALLTLAACTAVALPAHAAIVVSSVPGSDPYAGPAPTYNFDSPTAAWDGSVFFDSLSGHRAQPFGSTGGYASVGADPDGGVSPGTLDVTGPNAILSLSFIWGSIDDYNQVEFQDALGNVLATFTGGSDGIAPADGNQTSADSNRLVTFTITGDDRTNLAKLVFTSGGQNAFEFDNVFIERLPPQNNPVPEPATWAMMIAGFGLIGASMRIRRTRVFFA
ncbi:Npun_F0296 family exosortase-dependent surface protein [Sphingomonas sp. MM-1]|uniref:Npun_F0296 family exosortase-dependent surface protein n=1 Tax=Sphingomonas sp. MM-1 TaxID=745310 RepID=UPI000AD30762|nr:PEPxxWA-CTERM sorting domain-containing protein [Sphingomonas sp. MM-1]